jgi:DNA-binding response OmpR family regulator
MHKPIHVLAVVSQTGNMEVLCRFLEKMNLVALNAKSLKDIDGFLNEALPISLAIIDIMGFGNNIWDYCRLLREKGIPMLIISPSKSDRTLEAGYAHGAKRVFEKPVMMQELATLVKLLIRA